MFTRSMAVALVLVLAPLVGRAECGGAADLTALYSMFARSMESPVPARAVADLTVLRRSWYPGRVVRALDNAVPSTFAADLLSVIDLRLSRRDPPTFSEADVARIRSVVSTLLDHLADSGCLSRGDLNRLTATQSLDGRLTSAVAPAILSDIKPRSSRLPDFLDLRALLGMLAIAALVGVWLHRRLQVAEARASTRILVNWPVQLSIVGSEALDSAGRAADISRGGMKIAIEDGPPIGTSLTLTFMTQAHRARVIWMSSRFIGVYFDRPIERATFEALLDRDRRTRHRQRRASLPPVDRTPSRQSP